VGIDHHHNHHDDSPIIAGHNRCGRLHPAAGWFTGPPLAPMILLFKSAPTSASASCSSAIMIALACNTQGVVQSPIDGQVLLQRSQQAAIDANAISQSANDIA
jgi:hypothetical protein